MFLTHLILAVHHMPHGILCVHRLTTVYSKHLWGRQIKVAGAQVGRAVPALMSHAVLISGFGCLRVRYCCLYRNVCLKKHDCCVHLLLCGSVDATHSLPPIPAVCAAFNGVLSW